MLFFKIRLNKPTIELISVGSALLLASVLLLFYLVNFDCLLLVNLFLQALWHKNRGIFLQVPQGPIPC